MSARVGTVMPDPLPAFGYVAPTDWTTKIPPTGWPMLMNNQIGCCTISAVGHLIQLLTSYSRPTPLLMTDAETVAAYSAITGYNPADPATDQGAVIMDVLEYWMSTGITAGGQLHKIDGFAAINPQNPTELKFAIERFGAAYFGIELPLSAQSQSLFSVTDFSLQGDAAPGSWGGHCVPGPQFDPNQIGIVTWGEVLGMDWEFAQTYGSEAYAVWDNQDEMLNGLNRDGFSTAQLIMDLDRLRQGIPVG